MRMMIKYRGGDRSYITLNLHVPSSCIVMSRLPIWIHLDTSGYILPKQAILSPTYELDSVYLLLAYHSFRQVVSIAEP